MKEHFFTPATKEEDEYKEEDEEGEDDGVEEEEEEESGEVEIEFSDLKLRSRRGEIGKSKRKKVSPEFSKENVIELTFFTKLTDTTAINFCI